MTNRELIEILRHLPQDADVMIVSDRFFQLRNVTGADCIPTDRICIYYDDEPVAK